MITQFLRSEKVATDTLTFYFLKPADFRYVAGQFIEMHVKHDTVDERGDKRWFTLSSSPTEDHLAITTKITPTCSSFKHSLLLLTIGQTVSISESMGDFVLPKDESIPLVFIAGGIGITPYRSMIKWLTDKNMPRPIQLLYSTRDRGHAAFANELEQSFVACSYIIRSSQLSGESLLNRIQDAHKKHLYIAGPEPMTEAITKQLINLGINKYQLVTDYFPGYNSGS
jgi:ferredoxin-NADP reductase